MIATYYAIYEFNEVSLNRGEIILDGIIRNSEDIIYPSQETGINELPSECEAHHFKCDGYKIEICDFTITREFVKKYRTTGDKLNNY